MSADAFQGDIGKILDALGHGSFARPQSPHDLVAMEILPSIATLRARVSELEAKLEAAEQHVTICQRLNTAEVERRRKAEKQRDELQIAYAIASDRIDELHRLSASLPLRRESEKP